MSRFTYHAPVDPDCPDVRTFQASLLTSEEQPEIVEDFERRHRAECERCHVHGAVHMEIRDG